MCWQKCLTVTFLPYQIPPDLSIPELVSMILDAQVALDTMFESERDKFEAIEKDYQAQRLKMDQAFDTALLAGKQCGKQISLDLEKSVRIREQNQRRRVSSTFLHTYSPLIEIQRQSTSSTSTVSSSTSTTSSSSFVPTPYSSPPPSTAAMSGGRKSKF